MKCPNCSETLLMSQRNNVEIDYCPNCRGIWLDKGELDKLLEQADQRYIQRGEDRPSEYRSYDRDYDRHKKPYKKKGFLGDFFDFD